MKRLNLKVQTSDMQIANKFYTKVIGLRPREMSNEDLLFRGSNYSITITKRNVNNLNS